MCRSKRKNMQNVWRIKGSLLLAGVNGLSFSCRILYNNSIYDENLRMRNVRSEDNVTDCDIGMKSVSGTVLQNKKEDVYDEL